MLQTLLHHQHLTIRHPQFLLLTSSLCMFFLLLCVIDPAVSPTLSFSAFQNSVHSPSHRFNVLLLCCLFPQQCSAVCIGTFHTHTSSVWLVWFGILLLFYVHIDSILLRQQFSRKKEKLFSTRENYGNERESWIYCECKLNYLLTICTLSTRCHRENEERKNETVGSDEKSENARKMTREIFTSSLLSLQAFRVNGVRCKICKNSSMLGKFQHRTIHNTSEWVYIRKG